MVSNEGKVLYVSDNVEKYIGYSQLELIGLSVSDYLHQGDKSKFYSYITRYIYINKITVSLSINASLKLKIDILSVSNKNKMRQLYSICE